MDLLTKALLTTPHRAYRTRNLTSNSSLITIQFDKVPEGWIQHEKTLWFVFNDSGRCLAVGPNVHAVIEKLAEEFAISVIVES
jgi:hypothetical protein